MRQRVGGRRRGEDAFRLIDHEESELLGPGPSREKVPADGGSLRCAVAPGAAPAALSLLVAYPHQATLLS